MSPTNSTRTGSTAVAGNTSTIPPRMAKAPCSSTGSSRVKPPSTSRSASCSGSISEPTRSSIEAASMRSGGLIRGNIAAADATMIRADPETAPCSALRPRRRDAEMRRHPSIGIDLQRGEMKNGLLNRCVGRGLESAIEEADVSRELLGVGVCRRDRPLSRPAGFAPSLQRQAPLTRRSVRQ